MWSKNIKKKEIHWNISDKNILEKQSTKTSNLNLGNENIHFVCENLSIFHTNIAVYTFISSLKFINLFIW